MKVKFKVPGGSVTIWIAYTRFGSRLVINYRSRLPPMSMGEPVTRHEDIWKPPKVVEVL